MIDYLFKFTDEAEAIAALQPLGFYFETEDGGVWDGSRVINPITVTMLDLTVPAGYWLAASVAERREDLDTLCQAAINRFASGTKLSEYVEVTTWPTENIDLVAQISPVWAGSNYPFPGLPVTEEPVAP